MLVVSFSIEKILISCSYHVPIIPPSPFTPTESNLYLANSLTAAVCEPDLPGSLHSKHQISCSLIIAYVIPNYQYRSEAFCGNIS